jgi:integrase
LEALSKERLLALLAAARAHRERDWLMILVGYRHGLRPSEVVAIRTDDIKDDFFTVRRFKGSMRTVHPLFRSDEALLDESKSLVEYTEKMPRNQRLFSITRRTFGRIIERHARTAGSSHSLIVLI